MKNSKSNPGLPVSFGRICVLVLMLLCSFGIVSASQQSQAQTFISAAHPTYPANLYYFNAIISQSLTSTLSNTTGIILLPVAANPVDLPSEIWICPSMNFSLNAKDSSNWNVSWDTSLITHTEYIPKSDRACPITLYNLGCGNAGCINTTCNQWSPQSSRIPIFWKASALASQIQAFGIGGNNAFFIHQSDSPSIPYSQFPLNANINVNYYPLYGKPDVYPNQKAEAGMTAYGAISAKVDSVLLSSQSLDTGPSKDWSIKSISSFGDHVISVKSNVSNITGIVHLLPDVSNADFNIKNVYAYLPVLNSNTLNYTIHVVNTTNCSGTLVYIEKSLFTNLAPGQTLIINVTVQNDHTDMPIIPSNVSASGGWGATPALQPPSNGFGIPIAPGQKVNITVNLTANSTPSAGPVIIYINFTDPCLGSHMCPANITVNILPTSTKDDLASLVNAPLIADVGSTVTIRTITFNNGTRPTPNWTNTSVDISGQATKYFTVPINLPQTTYPSATDPTLPDGNAGNPGFTTPPRGVTYIVNYYTFKCDYPRVVQVMVNSNWNIRFPEMNYANNIAAMSIMCGRMLFCPDYA